AVTVPFAARADSPQEKRRERYADRIENAFKRHSILARFDLDADAKGERTGYIEIEGRVRNASQRNRAVALARRVAPGYRIVNRIQISSRAGRFDDDDD
ncbi:MAG TPA: BON domain-containing protein, partial [Abditibacteriaceae bacterium]|nr:BON domain-containing protein [Abditibacteriaceae bacterium]